MFVGGHSRTIVSEGTIGHTHDKLSFQSAHRSPKMKDSQKEAGGLQWRLVAWNVGHVRRLGTACSEREGEREIRKSCAI